MLTHAYATPTDWPLPTSCPQMKVCRGRTINFSTHHIDFGNHIDASNVNVHSHGHRGTCKPRLPATWFLRTSFILSKSCPWAWGILPHIPPRCLPSYCSLLCSFLKRGPGTPLGSALRNMHTRAFVEGIPILSTYVDVSVWEYTQLTEAQESV